MENARTKKLPAVWHKFKAPRDQWPLVSICRLSNGKQLVLWLLADGTDDWTLDELEIDAARSREVMGFLVPPEVADLELVAEEFQAGSGSGAMRSGKSTSSMRSATPNSTGCWA